MSPNFAATMQGGLVRLSHWIGAIAHRLFVCGPRNEEVQQVLHLDDVGTVARGMASRRIANAVLKRLKLSKLLLLRHLQFELPRPRPRPTNKS